MIAKSHIFPWYSKPQIH